MIKRNMNRGKPYSLQKKKPPHDLGRIGPPKKKKHKH